METKLFNHGNPHIRSTGTHMNYELGRLIVKHGAEFGGDSVKIFQMANFITSSARIKNKEMLCV